MRWSRILATYSVAVALTGYLYVHARERPQPIVRQAEALAPLVQADATAIDSIDIAIAGTLLTLKRDADRWKLVQTVIAGTDHPQSGNSDVSNDLIDALVEIFTVLPVIEAVSQTSGAEAEFGLVNPAAVVSMAVDGIPQAVIEVGNHSPTATAVYARRRGSSEIYLVGLNTRYYIELLLNEVLSKNSAAP